MLPAPFLQFAVALGLGLLVGLQRERMDSAIAGIRTFALITLFGAVAGQLGQVFGGWVVAVGLLAAAGLVTAGNLSRLPEGKAEPGQTTEFAAVLMYGIGAWVVVGSMTQAVVLGGVVAVLLQLREPLHQFAGRMGEPDIKAIMQLVLIALVILPLLPDRTFGPYGVLNPYQIWWMVVLIVGLSLLGYVGYKLLGARAGTVLAGILGGVISSTATTASYARRTKQDPGDLPAGRAGGDDRLGGGLRPRAGRDRGRGPRQLSRAGAADRRHARGGGGALAPRLADRPPGHARSRRRRGTRRSSSRPSSSARSTPPCSSPSPSPATASAPPASIPWPRSRG